MASTTPNGNNTATMSSSDPDESLELKMTNLIDCVENSIWHAFDYVALDGDGTAPKAKLKTLTSQIGAALELEDVANGLEDYRSTPSLSFDQYRFYLFKEVFSAIPEEIGIEGQHAYEAKLDQVCWSLCSPNYLERDNPVFPDDCVFKLFRVFCMLGDMVENDQGQIEVIMAAGEVENAAYQFMMNLGRGMDWDPEEFDCVASVIPVFKFGIFLTVLESKYAIDVDEGCIIEAVRDVHDHYLRDVVRKGHIGKRMDLLPAFREYYFVLQPHKLTYYNGASQKDRKGEIKIDAQCRVEPVPDSNSKSPIKKPGSKHHSRFQLFACEKTYEFQASDHRTRLQWLSSFRVAIEYSGEPVRHQRQLLEKRRIARQEEKDREGEDFLRNNDIGHQLEVEREARANAEEKAATLVIQRELEGKKMMELEKIREQLEGLLDEERQAKRDEEIVRTLQARILNEEWARRETLERLQEEQKHLLEAERRKREEFERLQNDKETQLRDAQARVEEMEKERRKLDKQLDLAQEKTKKANLGQEVLEAKIKVKEHLHTQERDRDSTLSRMTSLNPSSSFYIRNRDRSGYMPMRSASMRETSYSRSIRRNRQKTARGGVGGSALGSTGDNLSVNEANLTSTSEQNINAIQEATNGHSE
eukprot:maker-scaffold407_size180809-snap-gene-0.29 protein:Tk12626 transcript:maker-scaffold407_size180809-snap-gene-0.29-mRNA-1 annotation:"differentially expressed in fdcp 6-like protein"